MKKKKAAPVVPDTYTSPLQTEAQKTSEDERAQGNQALETAKTGYGNFLPGSEGMSEYRRNVGAGLYHAAAGANENAIARMRERAQAAGFGGKQPITFGAETGLANENASRLAQIPLQVEQAAMPYEMQGIQGVTGIGESQLGDARSMFGQAAGMEDQRLNEFYRQQEEARKRKAGIWGSLAKIGLNVGGALIGGPGGAAAGNRVGSVLTKY